jgi:hypothetical protein
MPIVEGGCLCGAVRYRLSGEPLSSIVCHCNSCRKASGAPLVAWLTMDRAQFQWLSGSPQFNHSSPDAMRRFCSQCGTQLTYENSASPNTIDVTTATLDDAEEFPPTMEVWLEHRLNWQPVNETLGQYRQGTEEMS